MGVAITNEKHVKSEPNLQKAALLLKENGSQPETAKQEGLAES